MKKKSLLRIYLAVGIILLFIGIAITPSINFHVVKASNDNDLIEVTTQACSSIEPRRGVKRGTVKIHFYEDLDNDSVFDPNEPSPPIFIVHLKTQYLNLSFMVNRFKIIGCRGNAIFRFIPYPAIYNLTAHFERNIEGIMTEGWIYNGILNLNEDLMGTQIYLPIRHYIIPI
jgi:hypothetical protein